VFLYLPEGTYFKPDSSLENYDRSDNDFFNLHHSSDKYTYKVTDDKVLCLNCPPEEDEFNDVETEIMNQDSTATIQLNKDGILIKKGANEESEEVKSIKINEDGVTIKKTKKS
jgi:hypothetical protein